MNCSDQRIGRARYDSERQLGPILLRIPRLIQAREQQEATGARVDPERLPLALGTGPFEKAIGGNDATALLKCFAEGWPPFERLGPGVDTLAGAAIVPRRAID